MKTYRRWLAAVLAGWATLPAAAQQPATAPPPSSRAPAPALAPAPKLPPVKKTTAVAATVNGQPIPETAVLRGLRRVPPANQAEARVEIVNYLVENALIEQHLLQLRVAVDPKEVDKKIAEMKAEIAKQKLTYAQVLEDLALTEAELGQHIAADLRWEKYANSQATDAALQKMFADNKDMFDGSMVHVRHILLTPDLKDAKAVAVAKAQLAEIKKSVEAKAAAGLAKLPANTSALDREKARVKLVEDAFAEAAKAKSACPSKQRGGDVGWFDRAGPMVEPFARAAFALKPFQVSDIVETQFGFHLLLLLERRAGKAVKFDEVKADVREVYCDRLRESLATQLRARAKISVNTAH